MTSAVLLEQYLVERHALGFSLKTDEGCLRRFLRNYPEPDDGKIVFTKEFVMAQVEGHLNRQKNTILRDVIFVPVVLKLTSTSGPFKLTS